MHRSNSHRPLLVGFIGFSQSGKSSRIENIMRLAGQATPLPEVPTRIYEKNTRNSRHFLPLASLLRSRSIDVVLVSIDYTGHDHLAAYLFTRRILEVLDRGLVFLDRKRFLQEMVETSHEVLDGLVSQETRGIRRDLLMRLVESPLPLYADIKEYFDPYMELCNAIRGLPCRQSEIVRLIEEVKQAIRGTRKEVLSYTDLNEIICMLESTPESKSSCINIGKLPQVEVSVDYTKGLLLRLVLTAPLLTYLLMGLLIESNILFIPIPASIRDYLNQLKKTFIEKDSKDPTILLANLRALAWSGENTREILESTVNSILSKGGGEDAEKLRAIIDGCISESASKEVARLGMGKEVEDIVGKASPFTSINGYNEFTECLSKSLGEYIKEGVDLREALTDTLTRVVLEKYQLDLLNNMLRLLEYVINTGVNPVVGVIVFDYTYMDKAGKGFKEIVSESLSGELLDLKRDVPALSSLYSLISKVFRRGSLSPEIYAIPSSMRNNNVTPLEYMMLICLLEDKLASFRIVNSATSESRDVSCIDIVGKAKLSK